MNDVSKPKKNISLYLVVLTAAIVVIALFFILTLRVGEKAVITDYSVTTQYTTQEIIDTRAVLTNPPHYPPEYENIYGPVEHSVPGFCKNLSSDADIVGYSVTFKVRNQAGEHLDVIGVKVIFCDKNSNELYSTLTSVYDIPNSYVKESSVIISETSTAYFYSIEKVRFEIIAN